MKGKPFYILLSSILMLIPFRYSFSQNQSQNVENKIVNGTAEFLTERANENFFYIFENKLKDNELLKNFFPSTYQMLSITHLKILLTNKDIWDNSIKKDLSQVAENFFKTINEESKVLPVGERGYIDLLLEQVQGVEIKIGNDTYQLNAQPLIRNKNVKFIYNSIYSKFDELKNVGAKIKNLASNNIKSIIDNKDSIHTKIKEVIASIDNLESIYNSKDFELIGIEEFQSTLDKLKSTLNDISELYGLAQVVMDTSKSNTYRVLSSFKIIEYIAEKLPDGTFSSPKIKKKYEQYFNNFKLYALFFAQLSEAQSKDEVKSILTSVTLPPVSFGTKRDNSKHIFISSYWGLSLGIESINHELNFKKQNTLGYTGLTAPIGLEHSWGLGKNGSISIFASILDFGPVVNSQLFDSDSNMKLKDIISPGIYFVYGIPEMPLAISIGYFHSKAARLSSSLQHHITLNIVFDMPLMIFY